MNLASGITATRAERIDLTFAPLDVPLRIESRDDRVAAAVAEACGCWEGSPESPVAAIRLKVRQSNALGGTGVEAISIDGSAVRIEGCGVRIRADISRRSATCAVSADYLADPALLRRDVLEPVFLTIASRHDRTPVHASGFIHGGLAVLLAGHSGSGKSCLAVAADRAGLQLLSDDTVHVQQRPRLRVWGWPSAAHLFPADGGGEAWPTRQRNGKTKQVVPLRSASAEAVCCDRAVMCVLDRGNAVALSRIGVAEVFERLWPLEPGFDLVPGEIASAISTLAARGAWRLTLSDDPDEAIRLILAHLTLLDATAAP